MSLSLLSRSKTVLLISDEALYVYGSTSKGMSLIDTVPWGREGFEKEIVSIITKKCGRKPVLILNDMVEQHYRKEKVVKVGAGFGDKAGMVRRKLNVAFPNYPVRAAFPLKEKIKKSEGQLAADIYIFAAVPNSTQFNQTMSAASKSLASISGFCLLPVEAADMLKALSSKLSKDKKAKAAKWCVFMGQHRSGGLRQVVTKNGEIALTRMTPISESPKNHDAWAAEVHHEFKSTMSYLSRFGFVPEDTLDAILISNSPCGDVLNAKMDNSDTRFHTMTPHEAAQLINVNIGRIAPGEESHYADVLHVAWNVKKGKYTLPMKASKVDELTKPRKVALLATVLLACGAAFFGYQAFTSYQSVAETNRGIDKTKNTKAQLDIQYKTEVEKKEKLGFNVRLVQSSIKVRDEFDANNIEAIDVFAAIGATLGKDLRIDRIDITPFNDLAIANAVKRFANTNEVQKQPLYTTRLKMSYPSTTDIERGNQEVNALNARLTAKLPNFKVRVSKLLKDYEYTEGLIVETGDVEKNDLTQDFLAEITIEGPMKVKNKEANR